MQHLYRCHLTYTDAFPDNIDGLLKNLFDEAVENMLSSSVDMMSQEQVCKKYKEASTPSISSIKIIYNFSGFLGHVRRFMVPYVFECKAWTHPR